MMTFLVVIVMALQVTSVILGRRAAAEQRQRAQAVTELLTSALAERLDVHAFVRQRITERPTEFRTGGGRDRLRECLQARENKR